MVLQIIIILFSSFIIQLTSADVLGSTLDPENLDSPNELKIYKIGDPALLEYQRALIQILQSSPVTKIGAESSNPLADLEKYNNGLSNEDLHLNSTQFLEKYDYPMEVHEVVTPDGYLLTMIRIPALGPPTFLMHGLFSDSDCFLSGGPDYSLAYLLADAGYDVWMGNARGNRYSKKHECLSPSDDDAEFWDFSWHEIGVFDIPTMIDFVLEKVDYEKLYYIGHSQGTTVFYVLLSEKPEYNEKFALMVSLAPIAWMEHLFSPPLRAFAPFVDEEEIFFKTIGLHNFVPNDEYVLLLRSLMCGTSVLATTVCSNVGSFLWGFNYPQINLTNYPVQTSHSPDSSATKQVIHYLQLMNSGHFRLYDHGEENMEIYGRATPPDYDVTKISAPVALFYSSNDWLSSLVDVGRLASKIQHPIHHKIPIKFNHMDYVWGKDIKHYVHKPILKLFKKYEVYK